MMFSLSGAVYLRGNISTCDEVVVRDIEVFLGCLLLLTFIFKFSFFLVLLKGTLVVAKEPWGGAALAAPLRAVAAAAVLTIAASDERLVAVPVSALGRYRVDPDTFCEARAMARVRVRRRMRRRRRRRMRRRRNRNRRMRLRRKGRTDIVRTTIIIMFM
jgi:hypothetical protein